MARHTPTPPDVVCDLCGAYVANKPQHVYWHSQLAPQPGRVVDADEDAPTVSFPPIRDTVFRRPPPPEVRELKGAELLRAIADELAALGDEDQDQ